MNDAPARTRLDPPHLDTKPHPVLAPAGLCLLMEAYQCVREMAADEWQFAVEIGCLLAAGLTNTSLRWLLHQGYVLQGVEQTEAEARQRAFRQVGNLSLPSASCFVLTDAGAAYALDYCRSYQAESPAGQERRIPVWDLARRELRAGLAVVKRFKQPAANQELVLQAFQEEGWPPRIDDPLPPEAEQDPKRRLHTTISNLNRGQRDGIKVHFAGGGEGQSVCWRLLWGEARERR